MRTHYKCPTDPTLPSLEELRKYLRYCPNSGKLTWIAKTSNRCKQGEGMAGTRGNGMIGLSFKGVMFKAHRVAWALHYGEWPNGVVDHINRNPYDNRISNLRVGTQQQNTFNCSLSKNNTSGYKGVYLRKDTGKWAAEVTHNRKKISLGCFLTAEEAAAAYDKASKELFKSYASPNMQ
jgi:hypothetical protein